MAANHPDLLLEEAFRGRPARGAMPLVDAPRTERQPMTDGFDWRPTILLLSLGAAMVVGVVYLA